jgi:hypothetical protein
VLAHSDCLDTAQLTVVPSDDDKRGKRGNLAESHLSSGVQRCPLFQKGSKYLADWYDRKGKRKRKSFSTPEEAQAHEDAMDAIARPKRLRGGRQSPQPSRRLLAREQSSTRGKSQTSSRGSTGRSGRTISIKRTSPSSTNGSGTTKTASRSTAGLVRRNASSATCGKSGARHRSTAKSSRSPNRNRATLQQRATKGRRS